MMKELLQDKKICQLEKCSRCGNHTISTDILRGEIYCSSCGVVIVQKFESSGHDWRNFEDGRDRRQTGDGFLLSIGDYGLSTIIDTTNRDSQGIPLSRDYRELVKRIRIQDIRSKSSTSLVNSKIILNFLDGVCDKLGITHSVKEDAAYIYRKAVEKKLTMGRSIQSVMAASVYIACRNSGTLRTLRDVSIASDIRIKRISQSYRSLVTELDLTMPIVDQIQYISKISSILKLTEKTKRFAIEILHNAQVHKMLDGRDPVAMAAAAIYLACELKGIQFSQKAISDASGISPVTIRNRYKELHEKLEVS